MLEKVVIGKNRRVRGDAKVRRVENSTRSARTARALIYFEALQSTLVPSLVLVVYDMRLWSTA
ncbi:hypothetical protein ASPWEDRAFT_36177 [Aspergillus wentii DTO 134E9]|uniref:Uncharacterized protein n=1 Tax=Aspergillus wentii DTO 134E9 TaxID=1073089 RepID=A0A1L9RUC5_ASPWE|nr:uncharacterized protein ASPWEDRAFT_36177 [Aspergillus wentii DTO 134E9]OJJ38529.1 hypothetical protein ASPWEDRAFT_36177 [Aspergillus wentii DTO 134E9]